ncbi:peptide chain release factor N(5)-glutamine methyltransferase [Winogradskyella sp.]|uniref:peptide chain release factor N(5)-glutamine methyltransferase n=1 Tax=Winogradskyella sp. TaxID=1883156 RepID=UPI002623F79C|nr:peptide chain release factor N(5)-glutamine methyltransferase [Winogradskyella sp.]
MKALDLKDIYHKELDAIYGKDEVENFFFLTTEHHFNIARIQLALEPELSFTKPETDVFFKTLDDLKQQKPIQYILGEMEFYGLKFKVNTNVLIPRPETEELVDWIVNSLDTEVLEVSGSNIRSKLKILDIGTGSGCIAISLAKHLPNAKVYALDVSKKALEVAKDNAKRNNVKVNFVNGNILNTPCDAELISASQFDIIVSNPPYVRQLEKAEMQPNVLNNEPHLALFVDDENPLKFYRVITTFAVNNLKHYGHLYFEINQYLGKDTKQLLVDANFQNVELRKDINGNDRMLKAQKN